MDKIKLYVFHTGKVRVDCAIPLREKKPLAKFGFLRSKDKQVVLPVSAYFIVHPKGNVLIDTGWDTKYAVERPKQLCGLIDKISAPIISENEGIDKKLKSVGFSAKDIDYVFISHMDFDHVSGLRLVRNAKSVLTSTEEWAACNRPGLRYVNTWNGVCEIKTFEYSNTGIGPVGRSYDVFGDGTIVLVHTPGHSKGLFCVLIQGKSGYIVLGSDVAYTSESFSEHRLPGFTVNKKLAKESLEWLIQSKNDPKNIAVFVNHDPDVKEQVLELNL